MSKIILPVSYRPKKRKRIEEPVENTVSTENKTPYKFSCAMLNISDDIVPIIKYWIRKFIPCESLYINEDEGMDGYEDIPHVTIKYGIHESSPDKLKSLVYGYGTVGLNFGTVSRFDINPKFDVLKIEMNGEKLTNLNKIISDNMESTDTFDQYKPHCTLAFIQKGSCTELDGNDFFTDLKDLVDEIYFTSKEGKGYFIEL